MKTDGQMYVRCADCGAMVNDSESLAHQCPHNEEPIRCHDCGEYLGKEDHQCRRESLCDAMENHGNAEGTETQLGDAEEFLKLALDIMSIDDRDIFFNHPDVKEFIEREG